MHRLRSIPRPPIALALICALSAWPAAAGSAEVQPVLLAQGDCYAIGAQIAAQNGGTLAKASPSSQGGQSVCVVVILVPGKDGQRPRRVQMVVPQN